MNRITHLKYLTIIGLGFMLSGLLFSGCSQKTGPETISGNGTIEATEVDLSAKISGKIMQLSISEGDNITKDQLVAKLDDTELTAGVAQAKAVVETAKSNLADLVAGARKEEIAQAQANVAAAKSNYENMVAGPRPQEIDTAKAALSQASSNLDKTSKDWTRMENLLKAGAISVQQRDEAKAAYDSALSQRDAAKSQLDLLFAGYRPQQIETAKNQYQAAQQQLNLVLAGSRPETIAAARARLRQAEATLQQLQAQLTYTVITSPLNGVVLIKNMELGELANIGSPIVTIADLDNVWLRVYVPEPDIGKIKLGQSASVTVDSYPTKSFQGKVAEISSQAEFTPKNIQTKKERVNLVFGVKINLSNPEHLLKPGMPADAEIIVNENNSPKS